MPATYMSRSCSFRERQKSRTPRTLGYFYPLILSVRQFDDSGAFAQGLVARYICVKRPGLGNKSPYELVEEDDEDFKSLMSLLKMHLIPPDEVHLMPDLFVKK